MTSHFAMQTRRSLTGTEMRLSMNVRRLHYAAEPSQEFGFTSADGLRIACARWDGSLPVRAVIQIAHGMGEHFGRYGEAIAALLSVGFTVYANDHRGHGRTAAAKNSFGDFGESGFDLLVEDMAGLSAIARAENPGLPLFLFGHSMGSFAAQQYALSRSSEIDGLILSGTGILDGLANLASVEPSGVPQLNESFEPARTPFDWLSRDPMVVDAFLDDPLCFAELAPSSAASFLAAAHVLSDPLRLRTVRHDLPIYVFSGNEDPVGQELDGVRTLLHRYRQAGLHDVSHDFYAGGRHEMLNETNRREVLFNMIGWVASTLAERREWDDFPKVA
jgi:alpha-beta hydrolase superfamily lysophospholipase